MTMSTIPDTPVGIMLAMGSLAERIESVRAERGISFAELGRRCGVTRAAARAWCSGESKGPTPENLVKAADVLGVEIRWLATGQGPKERRGLDQGEKDWLTLYHKLPEDRKQAARAVLDPSGEYNIDGSNETG